MRLLWLGALAPAVGCGGGSVTTVNQLPDLVRLAIGDEVQVAQPDLRLGFEAVTQDSRCPVRVVCIQAGSVTLQFRVVRDGVLLEGGLRLDSARPDSSSGVVLSIVEVTPLPELGGTIDPKAYRVSLRIEPLASP